MEPSDPDPLRPLYARHGVEGYYRTYGATYRNPHEARVRAAIRLAVQRWDLPLGRTLDLACGSGEATLELRDLGCPEVEAADPFTGVALRERTGLEAEPLTFSDVADGALAGRHYDLIVVSHALHLAEPSRLPVLCHQIARAARFLLVVTPNKRPAIRDGWGLSLLGELRHERTRARAYTSSVFEADA